MSGVFRESPEFEVEIDVVVVGAGACGLCVALAARDAGAEVLVLERDKVPLGTTAMSTGLIPAAGTKLQREAGIVDDAELFAADLLKKSQGTADEDMVRAISAASTETVDWMTQRHSIPLELFRASASLPGHSRVRLHGTPNRSGEELMASLLAAAESAGADILTNARVISLFANSDNRITGVEFVRPDGSKDRVGCGALVLASCGFAGNAQLVAQHIPELSEIAAHTHPGAQGDALAWGMQLGAATANLDAYQGHANLAAGLGLLVSWLSVTEGGIQVNADGRRFSNEARGYSEQAVDVGAQAGGVAWTIYDQRVDAAMREIAEYRDVASAGALIIAKSVEELADRINVPLAALTETLEEVARLSASNEVDAFGRKFAEEGALSPPYIAVKVSPALFHTQGGLVVNERAQVLDGRGQPLPNLFAGGGAARGFSGSGAAGYVAGNGLMSATTLGRLAGEFAGAMVGSRSDGALTAEGLEAGL